MSIAIEHEITENSRFEMTYPTTIRICDRRLLFGVRKASEFEIVPAITKVTSASGADWFSSVTVVDGPVLPVGIDLGGNTVDCRSKFNLFGLDISLDADDGYTIFRTSLVTGDQLCDMQEADHVELSSKQLKLLYGLAVQNTISQMGRFIDTSKLSIGG